MRLPAALHVAALSKPAKRVALSVSEHGLASSIGRMFVTWPPYSCDGLGLFITSPKVVISNRFQDWSVTFCHKIRRLKWMSSILMPQTLTHSRYCLTLVFALIQHQNSEHIPYTHSHVCLIASRCRCLCSENSQESSSCANCVTDPRLPFPLNHTCRTSLQGVAFTHTHVEQNSRGEVSAAFLNPAFLLHMLVYVVVFFFCSHTPKRWISFEIRERERKKKTH